MVHKIIKNLYACNICGEEYEAPEKAKECEDKGYSPIFSPGNLVKITTTKVKTFAGWTAYLSEEELKELYVVKAIHRIKKITHTIFYSVIPIVNLINRKTARGVKERALGMLKERKNYPVVGEFLESIVSKSEEELLEPIRYIVSGQFLEPVNSEMS